MDMDTRVWITSSVWKQEPVICITAIKQLGGQALHANADSQMDKEQGEEAEKWITTNFLDCKLLQETRYMTLNISSAQRLTNLTM